MDPNRKRPIGIGPTPDLSLRVSVATLSRVIFRHPENGEWMLALERKATLVEEKGEMQVQVVSQPFGGAVQILDPLAFRKGIGDFNFDSLSSQKEMDFRIFIDPARWPKTKEFCIDQFLKNQGTVLDIYPDRELLEEVEESLNFRITKAQYVRKPIGIVFEENCSPTNNIRSRGYETVRLYRIFEISIIDIRVAMKLISGSLKVSDKDLMKIAFKDFMNGGKGRANGVLTLQEKKIENFKSTVCVEEDSQIFKSGSISETCRLIFLQKGGQKYRWL